MGMHFFPIKNGWKRLEFIFWKIGPDQIKIAGRTMVVTGLELPNSYYKKLRKHFLGKERLRKGNARKRGNREFSDSDCP